MRRRITTAAPKDRDYLEGLNLKALQKGSKPAPDQDKREFYKGLQEEAKSGPLFDKGSMELVEKLPELPKPVTKWLGNMESTEDVDPRGLNLIIDWVRGDREAKIDGLTWDQAMEAQQGWHEESFQSQDSGEYNTKDVVQKFGDGWTMVEIRDREDLKTEGDLMGHCVGGDGYWHKVESGRSDIYSLRDPSNKPHVTLEVSDDGELHQCFGKQNEKPVKKYNKYLLAFFDKYNIPEGVLHLGDTSEVPASTWGKLAEHEDASVREAVARNPSTPMEVLKELSRDSDRYVRAGVAHNRSASGDMLKELANDSSDTIREAVAKNRSTPVSVLKTLARSQDYRTRMHVAWNKSTPVDVLKELSKDRDRDVRWGVAQQHATPVDVLRALAKDMDSTIRSAIAINPSTPTDVLADLADTVDDQVRSYVALNPLTPMEVLNTLAQDRVDTVRSKALRAISHRRVTAAVKDREYLESLNLKQLQKTQKPTPDQDKRTFYQGLQEEAKKGPLFKEQPLDVVEKAPALGKPLAQWLGNLDITPSTVRSITPENFERLLTWVNKDPHAYAKLDGLNFDEAINATYGTNYEDEDEDILDSDFLENKVVYKFRDGWRIVELTEEHDILLEGTIVQNCLRDSGYSWYDKVDSGDTQLYSLRTPDNNPRVDIEVTGGRVEQIHGKQNRKPIPQYNPYIVEFLVSKELFDGLSLLKDADIPENVQEAVAKSKNLRAKLNLFNLTLPQHVLDILIKDPDKNVRERLAKTQELSDDMLRKLAVDKSSDVRAVIAEYHNDKLPQDLFNKLVMDSTMHVWSPLLRYNTIPRITAALLTRIARGKDLHKKVRLAEQHNLDPKLLKILLNDPDQSVQTALVQHQHATPGVVDTISSKYESFGDMPFYIRRTLVQTMSMDKVLGVLDSLSRDLVYEVAERTDINTPVAQHILKLQAEKTVYDASSVYRQLAGNPSLTPEVLNELWERVKDTNIIIELLGNPNMPKDKLIAIARIVKKHKAGHLADRMAFREYTPDMALRIVAPLVLDKDAMARVLARKDLTTKTRKVYQDKYHADSDKQASVHVASSMTREEYQQFLSQARKYADRVYPTTAVTRGGDVRAALQQATHIVVTDEDRDTARTYATDQGIDLDEDAYVVGDVAHILAEARSNLRLPDTLPFPVLLKSEGRVQFTVGREQLVDHVVASELGKALKMRSNGGVLQSPYFDATNPRMLHDFMMGFAGSRLIMSWGVRTTHLTKAGQVQTRIGGPPVLLVNAGGGARLLKGQHPVAWNGQHSIDGLEDALDVGPQSYGWRARVRPDRDWNYQWTTMAR